jgi:hypothetical protein
LILESFSLCWTANKILYYEGVNSGLNFAACLDKNIFGDDYELILESFSP